MASEKSDNWQFMYWFLIIETVSNEEKPKFDQFIQSEDGVNYITESNENLLMNYLDSATPPLFEIVQLIVTAGN